MCIVLKLRLIGLALALVPIVSATPVIVTSAEIDGYFGTATLLGPGGTTLFSKNYFFLANPISSDLAFDIVSGTASNANLFPILQNNVGVFATLDPSVFVQEINNNFCHPAGPLCNPQQPLAILPADANLTQALHSLPVPAGDIAIPVTDTGDLFKGNVQDVVNGFAVDGSTIIQASINMRLYEHDFTAQASPTSAAPEPTSGLLIVGALAMAFGYSALKNKAKNAI
jgi:hypothetical protein